jgi:thymidine phosphorylase
VTQFTFDARAAWSQLDAPSVIRTKRDGGVLSDAAIDWVIDGYTHGRVHDEQMSALLMAIFLRGMNSAELARWTLAMIASGERFDFGDLRRDGKPLALVDKHSTGGVGDKITIPLVPVVMACGAAVPQAAGRGLGHTGGTLDKLEAISGFTANCRKRKSANNPKTSARRSSRRATWRLRTARSTRCATSPQPPSRCR